MHRFVLSGGVQRKGNGRDTENYGKRCKKPPCQGKTEDAQRTGADGNLNVYGSDMKWRTDYGI